MRPLGESLREYLELDEPVLDLNVTPNRGDAMSVLGVAREVAALDRRARSRARRSSARHAGAHAAVCR